MIILFSNFAENAKKVMLELSKKLKRD